MARMVLAEVVTRFLSHNPGWGGSLSSDGVRLMSYGVTIGKWNRSGTMVVLPGSRVDYSRTMSRHRGMLKQMAAGKGIPIQEP